MPKKDPTEIKFAKKVADTLGIKKEESKVTAEADKTNITLRSKPENVEDMVKTNEFIRLVAIQVGSAVTVKGNTISISGESDKIFNKIDWDDLKKILSQTTPARATLGRATERLKNKSITIDNTPYKK